jgi:hypothetical protein
MSRGQDAPDLARLRERIERHQAQLQSQAEVSVDLDRQREARELQQQRDAARVEADARALEAQSRARWMRIFSLQAVVGLSVFVVAEVILARRANAEAPR